MKKIRRLIGFGIVIYLLLAVITFSGILGSALASVSEPLTLENAEGETLTVGSVSATNDGTNLTIEFETDQDYPLFYTLLTFRGNTGGITRAMSTGRTDHLTHKSDNHHTYTIPLSLIKNDSVEIAASADVIVNGRVTNTRKAFITIIIKVPTTTTTCAPTTTSTTAPTTTSTTAPTTTSTTAPTTTSTTVGATTTTTSGGGVGTTTSTTVGATTTTTSGGGVGTTTSTTVAATTTTTGAPGTTTTTVVPATTTTTVLAGVVTTAPPLVEREALPVTGSGYNWYLIGLMLVMTGAGLYLGSQRRARG